MEQIILEKANKNGWTRTAYRNEIFRTICFDLNKYKNENLEKNIIELLNKYNIIKYKIISYKNNEIISYTICLKEDIYNQFIFRIKNQESHSCYYNCFPIF